MNIQELEEFLMIKTAGEKWHLENENKLSPIYNEIPVQHLQDEDCYYFDFVKTLKNENIGIIKETRFTTIPPHYHKDMELNYIYRGTCTFLINGKEVVLQQGDLCILDTNVIHSATSYKTENDIVINIVFKKDFFNSVFLSRLSKKGIVTSFLFDAISKNRQHNKYLIIETQNNPRFHSIIQFLLCEYFGPSICYEELTQTYVTALFLELINSLYKTHDEAYDENEQESIISILNYIEDNYKDCSLQSLSEHFGYHPNYLSNLLKKKTGKSFIELKTMQQLTETAFLLSNSKKSIQEIILKVGCNNMNYFYKKFKSTYGMTPKEYRVSKITWEIEVLHNNLWCFNFFLYSLWGIFLSQCCIIFFRKVKKR